MQRVRRVALGALALVMAMMGVLLVPGVAAAANLAFTITDKRIPESSGLTRDVAGKRYWTVNDSGDSAVAYALSRKGQVVGSFKYRADPKDVEAVAMYGRRLYVADIGDNTARRPFVTVYAFDNPPTDGSTVSYQAYDFAYPDGKHDAETLLVDSVGRLYIVTKGGKDAAIYAAPGVPSRQNLNRLVKVGAAPPYVTDGVFVPGDLEIAFRTYVSVVVVDAISYREVGASATPPQPQGESISVSMGGKALLVGSEGLPSKTYYMGFPKKVHDVPRAGATPPKNPSPTPTPSASPSSGDEDPAGDVPDDAAADQSRTGTLMALGLAGVVAVVAGVVVVVVRRS
jgi:hypothetical protein